MKKTAVVLIVFASLSSGCVVYDTPYRDGSGHRGDSGGPPPHRTDQDRDGIPDNRDRRPNDPYRY